MKDRRQIEKRKSLIHNPTLCPNTMYEADGLEQGPEDYC